MSPSQDVRDLMTWGSCFNADHNDFAISPSQGVRDLIA